MRGSVSDLPTSSAPAAPPLAFDTPKSRSMSHRVSRVRSSCSSRLMESGMQSRRGFAGTVEVLSARGAAGPLGGGGDRLRTGGGGRDVDRPWQRTCGRARGRWSVRLEVGAGGGGSGLGWRHPASTPAAGAAEGGLDGPGADVGARAAGGVRQRAAGGPPDRPGDAAEAGVSGGPCPTGAVAPSTPVRDARGSEVLSRERPGRAKPFSPPPGSGFIVGIGRRTLNGILCNCRPQRVHKFVAHIPVVHESKIS